MRMVTIGEAKRKRTQYELEENESTGKQAETRASGFSSRDLVALTGICGRETVRL